MPGRVRRFLHSVEVTEEHGLATAGDVGEGEDVVEVSLGLLAEV